MEIFGYVVMSLSVAIDALTRITSASLLHGFLCIRAMRNGSANRLLNLDSKILSVVYAIGSNNPVAAYVCYYSI